MRILEKDNEIYKVPREMMRNAGTPEALRRAIYSVVKGMENRGHNNSCGASGINGYKVSISPDMIFAPYIPADKTPLVGNYSSTTISKRYGK